MKLWLKVILLTTLTAAALLRAQEFKVGSRVTDFRLNQLDGSPTQFSTLKGNTTVIMFISVQCPVSNSYNERMNALYRDYASKGVKFIAINANRTEPAPAVLEHARAHNFAFTTEVNLTLDQRAKYTVEDRKLQFEAVMRAYGLLRDMSFAVDRINGVHEALLDRSDRVKSDHGLGKRLQELAARADDIRKKIVATKEGGAITGEERIREKAAQLYGALADYEGRPADDYLSRIDSLKRELADVTREFDAFAAKDLLDLNASLTAKRLKPINLLTLQQWNTSNAESDGGMGGMRLNSLLTLAHAAAFSKAQR